jgi:hypothetical protein
MLWHYKEPVGQPELDFLEILQVQKKRTASWWAAVGSGLGIASSWRTDAGRMIDRG